MEQTGAQTGQMDDRENVGGPYSGVFTAALSAAQPPADPSAAPNPNPYTPLAVEMREYLRYHWRNIP